MLSRLPGGLEASMSRTRLLALGLLTVLLGPSSLAEAGVEVKKSQGGMEYSIRLPADFSSTKGARLVFAMHGRGGSHTRFMGVVVRAPYLNDAILVAPNASTNAQWSLKDLPVIAKLIDEVKARYHVTRTIMFGFSMGAYCSFSMGLNYPDKIQAVIPHSGGLLSQVPSNEEVKKQAFYVIHGDADDIVAVSQSQTAVKRLKGIGVTRLKYTELPGLAHSMHPESIRAAFKWIQDTLGPAAAPLSDKDAAAAIATIEDALKSKEWGIASQAFAKLNGATQRRGRAIAGLAKKAIRSGDPSLALAAIEAAGYLGPGGVAPLKGVSKKDETLSAAAASALARTHAPNALKPLFAYLKGKSEAVAVAAAKALGRHGGLPGVPVLIKALQAAGDSAKKAERREAIHGALKRISGKSLDSAKAWGRWLAQQKR
jgi:predicted esterase